MLSSLLGNPVGKLNKIEDLEYLTDYPEHNTINGTMRLSSPIDRLSATTNATLSRGSSAVPQRFNSTSQPDGNPIVRPELNSVTEIVPGQSVTQTSNVITQ
jgi:hypothetical protein